MCEYFEKSIMVKRTFVVSKIGKLPLSFMNFDAFLSPIEELKDCSICPRNCHADRFSNKLGYCKSDASFNIASICIHRGEEPVISGPKGICNIFFTNCNLQCIYCQNHQISNTKIKRDTTRMKLDEVVSSITEIMDQGINMVGFVSPSHFIPQMKVIIAAIESLGYRPIWVYNTNGYDKPETIKTLENLIDVYLPDLKYWDGSLALRFSDAEDYPDIASRSLKEMVRQKGTSIILSEDGTAESGVVVRHLIIPGFVENSLNVLRYIANEVSPHLHISLMSQYYPTMNVLSHPHLSMSISAKEYKQVTEEMESLKMYNGWLQEINSLNHYRPDFFRKHPFEEC